MRRVTVNLTQDTLGYIFSFLSLESRRIVEQVCCGFCNASINNTHLIEILTISYSTRSEYLNTIITRQGIHALKKLKMLIYDVNLILLIAKICKNLTHLCIMYDYLTWCKSKIIRRFLKDGNKLQYIELDIRAEHINNIAKNIAKCKKLKCIKIYQCKHNINSHGFQYLLKCPLIEFIFIRHAKLYDRDFENISNKWKALKYFNIEASNITDKGFEFISKCNLECIELYGNVTDVGFKYICGAANIMSNTVGVTNTINIIPGTCGTIKRICLNSCNNLTDGVFKFIPNSIESIILNRCFITDKGLRHIFERCRLKEVNISICEKLTDYGFENIPNSIEKIKLSELRNINLYSIFSRCIELKHVSLSYTHNNFSLEILQGPTALNYNSQLVPPVGVSNIYSNLTHTACGVQHIESITISSMYMKDDKVNDIFTKFTGIKQLILCSCLSLTIKGFENISKCIKLEKIIIYSCSDMKKSWLEYIVDNCLSLKSISIGEFKFKITKKIIQKCKKLDIKFSIMNNGLYTSSFMSYNYVSRTCDVS